MKLTNNFLVSVGLGAGLVVGLARPPLFAVAIASHQPAFVSQDQQEKDKKKDKKDRKKQDEPAPGDDSPDNISAIKRVIKRGINDFQDGFEGHSPRRVTDMLDDKFEDLPRFEDAVTQFLERTSEMRMNVADPSLLQAQPDMNSLIKSEKIGASSPLIESCNNFWSEFSFF